MFSKKNSAISQLQYENTNANNNKGKRPLNDSENYKNKGTTKKLKSTNFFRNLSNYLNNNKENAPKTIYSNKATYNKARNSNTSNTSLQNYNIDNSSILTQTASNNFYKLDKKGKDKAKPHLDNKILYMRFWKNYPKSKKTMRQFC
ncbi:16484_t:CDS:1 [Dentiscutata heterogama]|uniref:16484_t:CDS:1 n=1 Tax=Dentiscutata heterogama TaxID=1316150 RepID=A0ACA9KDH7_9GLOM|nr:16484_t:CDS:1 [Dentiscutata heterogama]